MSVVLLSFFIATMLVFLLGACSILISRRRVNENVAYIVTCVILFTCAIVILYVRYKFYG